MSTAKNMLKWLKMYCSWKFSRFRKFRTAYHGCGQRAHPSTVANPQDYFCGRGSCFM